MFFFYFLIKTSLVFETFSLDDILVFERCPLQFYILESFFVCLLSSSL